VTTIYHLWSRSRSPAHEAEQWLREVAPSLGLCRGCSAFRTDRAIDVQLHAPLDGSALNFFWTTRVGIASVELLDAIGREIVFKSLRLGRVLDTSGKPLSDVRTFRAVNNVRIRGGLHSTIRRCEVCNCILYAPVRSHHLVGDASNFIGLFGTDRGGEFIVDESIVEHIERPRFKNLGISKIRLFSQPLDRYPINLEEAPALAASQSN
jgi:hypothetical protein